MASSSEAMFPSVMGYLQVNLQLTGVEGGLQRGQTVILQHVEKCLKECRGQYLFLASERSVPVLTVLPALSSPRKRILAFLCKRPVGVAPLVSRIFSNKAQSVRMHTELGEDIPEPVDSTLR